MVTLLRHEVNDVLPAKLATKPAANFRDVSMVPPTVNVSGDLGYIHAFRRLVIDGGERTTRHQRQSQQQSQHRERANQQPRLLDGLDIR